MIHKYRDSMIILGIILALSLMGANGISFSGTTDNEAFQATVDADVDDAAEVNYAAGNLHFSGSGNANYAKSYKVGTTQSKVGIKIRGADGFEGDIGGRKDVRNKMTSAYLDVTAAGFNFLDAYGSSTAGSVKSGVDLEIVNGDATFSIGTWANGKTMKTVSSLATGDGNFIQGGEIEASGYFSGCKGELGTHVDEGYLEDYELSLASSKSGGCFAYQSADWALGDHMDFWAETKKTASGVTKEMDGYIEVYDGAIEDYEAYINDGNTYQLMQGFDYVSAANVYTDVYYMQLSKAGKLVAEADSYMSTGNEEEYFAGAGNAGISQEFETVDSEYFSMQNSQKEITKKATKETYASLNGNDIYAEDLFGASGIEGSNTGSVILADRIEADYIYVNNGYSDNLKKNGGFGRVGAEIWGSSDDSALTDYIGIASYKTATGEKEVSAQGHVDNQYGHVESYDRTNGWDEEYFNTGNGFDNYFYGKEVSASPWESTLLVGHQLDDAETIQHAIDLVPAGFSIGDSNIFLLEKTYNENNIVNNNNGYERSFNLLGAKYYLPYADENTVIDADTTGDGVGDDRIFDLYSDNGANYFGFHNIDFKNGNTGEYGGAINIRQSANAWMPTVHIKDSYFYNNKAAAGGAIENDGGNVYIEGSKFELNEANGHAGGAIRNQQYMEIKDTTFTDNNAVTWGGAIISTNVDGITTTNAYLKLTDCTFTGNEAMFGGAVANEYQTLFPGIGPSQVVGSGNDFYNNIAGGNGGAYYAAIDGSITDLNDCYFSGNQAIEGKAAYLIKPGSFHITGYIPADQDIVVV